MDTGRSCATAPRLEGSGEAEGDRQGSTVGGVSVPAQCHPADRADQKHGALDFRCQTEQP